MASYINYEITRGVNLGFSSIMILPLVAIMCITFARARRFKDPARVTTTYFKAVLPLALLWLVFYLISGILNVAYDRSNFDSNSIYHAQLRVSILSSFFSYLTDIVLIMTLVEMGNGFLFCLTQTRTGLQKAMRYAAIGTCTILAMMAITLFGIFNAQWSYYLTETLYGSYPSGLADVSLKMSSALTYLTFSWALALVAFAAVVFNKTKRNYVLKNSAMLFLVAAVLNLIPKLYLVFYVSIFILSNFYDYDHYETNTALTFVDPIITVWFVIAVFSLVCAILVRKHNGLWTTLQPWMDEQGPPALAANPSSKGPGEQWQEPSDRHVVGV